VAGIADTNTIDLVAQDPDGTYLLVMIEDRLWGADPDQATQLQAKINSYVGYVLDGTLVRDYPETNGQSIRIRLDCTQAPVGHFAHITDHAATQLASRGIDFEVNPRT
jgi:hypothetical protein